LLLREIDHVLRAVHIEIGRTTALALLLNLGRRRLRPTHA
jgi:hypothetical protein